MFDYSQQIKKFREDKVRLSETFKNKLRNHRQANRDRLIANLPKEIPGITISNQSFKPQGSMAMRTIIQTRFDEEEYDIDDGLVLPKAELVDKEGKELSAKETKVKVRKALEDERFKDQPRLRPNCVRVFYAEKDAEKHHVDFPVYRRFLNEDDEQERELASVDEWLASDPTQVNSWFENEIIDLNEKTDGKGTQLRILIQLLKRFSRSRQTWDLPNGMKLTMLASETQPKYSDRIDIAFRSLLEKLKERLDVSKVISNLAHPDEPEITYTDEDENVCSLLEKVGLALDKLEGLDNEDCTLAEARSAWDWVFKSDGFFADFDKKLKAAAAKASSVNFNFAESTPSRPVDHQGGGTFG